MGDVTRQLRVISFFGAASLLAVAAGCVAMARSGVPATSWMRTPLAWLVGACLAALLLRFGRARGAATAAVIAAVAALVATLFVDGQEGVHRWLDVGPLHINVAALLLPAAIVGLGAITLRSGFGVTSTLVIATVLLMQPDASQLAGFAAAAVVLLLRSRGSRWGTVLGLAVAIAFAASGWMRHDPLQPVPEVEQIFALCYSVSPILAAFAGLALAAAVVAPLALRAPSGAPARDESLALAAYFAIVSLAPLFRWFPVPLVGLGMSFPVGFWLGIALLVVMARSEPPTMQTSA